MKVGVAITDVLTGQNAAIAILGALNERSRSGVGQWIDLALFDTQISALVNVASNYLVSGETPKRLGNQHPNIVPYQVFDTQDTEMVIAVGNDGQFRRFCTLIGAEELVKDERFTTNAARIEHRDSLIPILAEKLRVKTSKHWLNLLNENGIPCGPINDLAGLFDEEQVQARDMLTETDHPTAGTIPLVGSPLKLSRTPVQVDRHPPLAGEHTEEILAEMGWSVRDIQQMKNQKVI